MSACTKIIGSNAAAGGGIIALTAEGQLISLGDYKLGTTWSSSTLLANQTGSGDDKSATAPYGLCGNSTNGIVAYKGNVVSYLSSLGNLKAKWKTLTSAKFDNHAGIAGMVGDPVAGLTAFGVDAHNIQQVAQLVFGDDKPEWKNRVAPPFKVQMIAGDTAGGVLIVGVNDTGVSQYSRSGPDCNCEWKTPVSLPFSVELVCGDATGGFVFYGEGQMQAIDPKGAVVKLPGLNFSFTAMTGNQKDGLAAVLDGGAIAYCTDLTKAIWMVVGGPSDATTLAAAA